MTIETFEKFESIWNETTPEFQNLVLQTAAEDKNKVRTLMYEILETETAKAWLPLDEQILNEQTDTFMRFIETKSLPTNQE